MARASPLPPVRTSLLAGVVAAGLALLLAHGYRALYLALGGTPFPEIDAVSTTLASTVPALLAALAYRVGQAWLGRRARAVFTSAVLAFGVLSAVPFFFAPPHPGFAALSAPLHVLVAGAAAFTIPAWVARAPGHAGASDAAQQA